MSDRAYTLFEEQQRLRGINLEEAKARLKAFQVETPSWGYGDQGTRFKTFKRPGAARTVFEKVEDAAQVHRLTGACASVAIHIPWDHTDHYSQLTEYASELGMSIGAVNPNLFQDDDYMLGSLCHPDSRVREKALQHMLECVEIAKSTGSEAISLWLADGTNYPGQDNLRERKHRLLETLRPAYEAMPEGMRLLIEYKFFEPAFYHTDLADWGMALTLANKLGNKAEVLVDTGHHAQGTNVEHIVAFLLDEQKLGGFHFNGRKYADDDLIVGSVNPYELFLIFYQIVDAAYDADPGVSGTADRIAYMIDQSHNIEPKIPAMIRSVLNVQTQFAKALLVNREAVRDAQKRFDILGAEQAVREAFELDVSPLLAAIREEMNVPVDPMKTYLESGYEQHIAEKRRKG